LAAQVRYIATVTAKRPVRPVRQSARLRSEYQLCIDVIAEARAKAKISESELGRRLGKPQSWTDKIESGARRIDFVEFIQIAEALDADPEKLLRECKRRLSKKT